MSYRFMRIIIFFDLPTETSKNKREYTAFRKFLTKNGFLMMQESVYIKLALNQTSAQGICNLVRKNKPSEGLVQMLTITEKQFQKIETITGEFSTDTIYTDERVIII